MSENQLVDEFRQGPGIEPPSDLARGVRDERRRGPREAPKTLEGAHAIVQAIAKRRIENDRWVRRWRFVEKVVYLVVLVGAYLLYYLIEKLNQVLSLPSITF
jgi:hypothetical protein